jgi:hypothetical protein
MHKLLAVVLILAISLPSFAAGVDRRAQREQARINNGIATGQLTAPEAARLQTRENRIERTIARDRAIGGGLNVAERAHIQRMENRQSRAIYRQKHDAQVR